MLEFHVCKALFLTPPGGRSVERGKGGMFRQEPAVARDARWLRTKDFELDRPCRRGKRDIYRDTARIAGDKCPVMDV